ncbi:glycosyltransferase [Shimia sp. R9_3]|uniref:glycosyltransferase n=1 Tax=Shimia sp. R9_3 TaxID=2821113 RepID=UPI001ADA0C9A|nr:glycosyltransferase [Shimia sp. R9_3]MBO9399400.1 glycosyltransferase [Shimia sp. R9_3]
MRITLIVANLKGGGVQRGICNLAITCLKQGEDVRVVSLTDLDDGHLDFGDVPVEVLGRSTVRSSLRNLAKIMKSATKEDVIITGQPHVNLAVLALKQVARSKARVFVTEHNPIDISLNKKEKIIQNLKWWFYPKSDGIFCVGKAIEDSLRERSDLQDHLIGTVHNPVFAPELSSGVPDSDCEGYNVLCIGRLHPQKNFGLAIEAVGELQKRLPKVRITIVGEGPEHKYLEKLAERRLLAHSYEFTGFQRDVYGYLRRTDCLLMSSRWEGFGIVIIEALYAGKNVVSTPCPGPIEILDNGRFGAIAKATPKALADALESKLLDPDQAEELRKRAIEVSDPVQVYNKYMALVNAAPVS